MADKKKKKKTWQTLRGMRDILPSEEKYWQFVVEKARLLAQVHGFSRLDTPILEEASLFEKGTGKQTDIVEKEMFVFEEKGGGKVALRPEFTPAFTRAYIEHGMLNLPQPVKMFTMGSLFRHDRPQAGRYREFHQFNAEIIGENDPVLDAQLILLAVTLFNECGIPVVTHINSLGSPESRAAYLEVLTGYYKKLKKNLCEDCQGRVTKNPLRLLDCKQESCQPYKAEAPQIVDYVSSEERDHFFRVIEYLDALGIEFHLNPFLVRGLDYYTRTVFEFYAVADINKENTQPGALGGGGRYDGLVELLGGREATPAAGMAIGIERLINKMKEQETTLMEAYQPRIFVAQLGEEARRKSLTLFETLRKKGFKVMESFSKSGLKQQLEIANKKAVEFTLIIGQKEMIEDTILVREMEGGIQETVPFAKIEEYLTKRLT